MGCGNGGRWARRIAGLLVPVALVAAFAASARPASGSTKEPTALVPPALIRAAQAHPDQTFHVIVQAAPGKSTSAAVSALAAVRETTPGNAIGVRRRLAVIDGVASDVSGAQLLKLAERHDILAITADAPAPVDALSSLQQWPFVSGVAKSWPSVTIGLLHSPAIAIVDSGVDPSTPDLAGRVIDSVTLTSLTPNSPGDGRGHGTFVASIAAGSAQGYTGALPNAPIVSIDVADDHGMALTSDVIAAADWILAHKDADGIRVANFSLHSSSPATIRFDPLDRAVERLWLSGIVVVAAAGNYATAGAPSGVPFAPANDPFVITVGADDIAGSVSTTDDFAAPWSAYGYTLDGFAKPDLAAPGRYMVAAVPMTSTLVQERPDRVVAPDYMQLSGTSFATPVVSGAAAYLLALHPDWTPDQVKGALLVSAKATPSALPNSTGVGEVDAARAAAVLDPPNPNLALRQFVVPDPAGGSTPVFDAASWTSAALASPTWDAASWTSASWTSASWTSASWTSASWTSASWTSDAFTSASWTSASWTSDAQTAVAATSASWTSASWTSMSTSDTSWTTNADDDALAGGGYWIDAADLAQAQAELGLTP